MNWGVNDVKPGSDELRILVIFLKKQLVQICHWARLVEIWTRARPVQLWSTGCAARLLGQWVGILIWAESSARELTDGRCRNSQHSKNCVSLSSCLKTKSKKVNKRFVIELPRVVSVSGFLCIWTFYIAVCYITSWQELSLLKTSKYYLFEFNKKVLSREWISFHQTTNTNNVIKKMKTNLISPVETPWLTSSSRERIAKKNILFFSPLAKVKTLSSNRASYSSSMFGVIGQCDFILN